MTKQVIVFIIGFSLTAIFLMGFSVLREEIAYKNRVLDLKRAESIREQTMEETRKKEMGNCLNQAEVLYSGWWINACKSLRLRENCNLPMYQVNDFNEQREGFRNACFKRYSK